MVELGASYKTRRSYEAGTATRWNESQDTMLFLQSYSCAEV